MDNIIGKKIKVITIGGDYEGDRRWEGHEGVCKHVNLMPNGEYQIWLEGMSIGLLTSVDTYEVIE